MNRSKLLQELKNREYRRSFVESHARESIAYQLRQMRKRKQWTGRDVAAALGSPKLQPMISRYENPDYGKYTVTTLLQLANVFDVALLVRFAPFSELVQWDSRVASEDIVPAEYSQDYWVRVAHEDALVDALGASPDTAATFTVEKSDPTDEDYELDSSADFGGVREISEEATTQVA